MSLTWRHFDLCSHRQVGHGLSHRGFLWPKDGCFGATRQGESTRGGLGTATSLVWPEHGGAMGGLGHGDCAVRSEDTLVFPSTQGLARLGSWTVYVLQHVWCGVQPKGSAFASPRWKERGGDHGKHATVDTRGSGLTVGRGGAG